MDKIIDLVSQETGVSFEELSIPKKCGDIMDARIVICYICIQKKFTIEQISAKLNISTSRVFQSYKKFNRKNPKYKHLEYLIKKVQEKY